MSKEINTKVEAAPEREKLGNRENKGPNYRQLKPEVKQCIDKLIY